MAFDCLIIDHGNKDNVAFLKKKFPKAICTTFIGSYHKMIDAFVGDCKTEYVWVVSSLLDYTQFDFDFLPEQFQTGQIHTWAAPGQEEGDVFLIPRKKYIEQMQNLKFLRDFKDINYKKHNLDVYEWPKTKIEIDTLTDHVKTQKTFYNHYYIDEYERIFPSLWDDVKVYANGHNKANCLIPKFSIKKEIYEYNLIYRQPGVDYFPKFDVVFVSNNEPQAERNFELLQNQNINFNLQLNIKRVDGVKGRTNAKKEAARVSGTNYFYYVPAKLEVDNFFTFKYVPDIFKSPRHYIFKCFNSAIGHAYGHQSIVLMNKKLCIETPENQIDFTLASPHESVDMLAGKTTFAEDPKVAFRTAFREVVKLRYFDNVKPTVENRFLLKKWNAIQNVQNKTVIENAVAIANEFDLEQYLSTYDWEFVDSLYTRSIS
jgi:hypothetical protein